jgi:hypothetical protein
VQQEQRQQRPLLAAVEHNCPVFVEDLERTEDAEVHVSLLRAGTANLDQSWPLGKRRAARPRMQPRLQCLNPGRIQP